MKRRRVLFTSHARRQLLQLKRWWQENSPKPEIVDDDLNAATKMLSSLPGIGVPYPGAPIAGVRRFYLERLISHLYYTFDEKAVVIRAIWHARRGSGPNF